VFNGKSTTGGGAYMPLQDCLCLPDNPSCGESLAPQCGGSCPDGFYCDDARLTQTTGGGAGRLIVDGRCECFEEPFDPGIVVGDCGEIRVEPGCANNACEECVCDIEPSCCEEEWDEFCALVAAGMLGKKKADLFGSAAGTLPDCSSVCLVQNLPRPAPALSGRGTITAILALLALGYLALRQTRST
jgi:hypothetical protein